MKHSPADITLGAIQAKAAAITLFDGIDFKVNALSSEPGAILNCADDPSNTIEGGRSMQDGTIEQFHGVQISYRSEDQPKVMLVINALQNIIDNQISPKLPVAVELADPADLDTMLGYSVLNLSRISGVGITRNPETDQWLAMFTIRATIEVA
jgi:hypothetical protein